MKSWTWKWASGWLIRPIVSDTRQNVIRNFPRYLLSSLTCVTGWIRRLFSLHLMWQPNSVFFNSGLKLTYHNAVCFGYSWSAEHESCSRGLLCVMSQRLPELTKLKWLMFPAAQATRTQGLLNPGRQTAATFALHIHAPQRMDISDFSNLLTFPLGSPIANKKSHYQWGILQLI